MEGYNPYGRAGAGAPHRDPQGAVVADLRAAGAVGISGPLADQNGMERFFGHEAGPRDTPRRRDPNAPSVGSPFRNRLAGRGRAAGALAVLGPEHPAAAALDARVDALEKARAPHRKAPAAAPPERMAPAPPLQKLVSCLEPEQPALTY
jgi:hypothetical protein